jgi:RHS repeat-associated protein
MFDYDTLGRLRRAYNPERNAVATPTTYGYDENSNLTERKESDSATVSLRYDVLNRLTSKTYVPPAGASDSFTPTATWCYDGTTFSGANCNQSVNQNSYGKLTEARSSVSSTIYTHDSLGRLLTSTQTTSPLPGQAFTYAYYLDDNVASVQYPSGKSVATCYDEHGRPVWVSKVKTAADCSAATPSAPSATDAYVSSAQYEPHGGLKQLQWGNLLWQSATYNGRLQPQTMSLGTTSTTGDLWQQTYDYGTHNNGNIRSLQMALPNQATVRSDYLYDPVNRLTGAVENGNVAATPLCGSVNGQWCQEYGYDHQGNRSITRETGLGSASGVPSTFGSSAHPGEMDNRIADSGWAYDGRGNLIQRPGTSLSDKFLYDVEDRMIAVCASTNGSCSDAVMAPGKTVYSYDAEGRRVRKQNNTSGATTYVYDGQGQLTAEYGLPASVTGTQYLTTDHLGNTRVIGSGAERHDYLPFGEEITVSAGNPRYGQQGYGTDVAATLKFTGKERDATGLDYFGARYFSAAQGRFTSPDEFPGGIVDPFTGKGIETNAALPYADITDPQTLNKYGYARNNPLRYVDPDGHQEEESAIRQFTEAVTQVVKVKVTGGLGPKLSATVLNQEGKIGLSASAELTIPVANPGKTSVAGTAELGAAVKLAGGTVEGKAQLGVEGKLINAGSFAPELKNTSGLSVTALGSKLGWDASRGGDDVELHRSGWHNAIGALRQRRRGIINRYTESWGGSPRLTRSHQGSAKND